MKRLLFILGVIGCLCCCGQAEPESAPATVFSIKVHKNTAWKAGDLISVNGRISEPLAADCEECAEFFFNGYIPAEGEILNILYPGSSEHAFDFPSKVSPMWATTVNPSEATLQALCSVINIKLHGTGILEKFVISSAAGEPVAGRFLMGMSDGAYDGNITGGSESQTEVVLSEQVTLSQEGITISIPVIAGNYTKGLTVKFYNTAGKCHTTEIFPAGQILDPEEIYEIPGALFGGNGNTGNLGNLDENILFDNGPLSVGTYNIQASSARESSASYSWNEAKSSIASIISEMNCDVMTLNEMFDTEINYLKGCLKNHDWILHANNDEEYDFAPGIIYRPARLKKLADGIFWLSDPDASTVKTIQSSYSYYDYENYSGLIPDKKDAGYRCCVWAKFKDNITNKEFYYFATHPATRGADSGSSKANTLDCLNAGNIRSLASQVPLVNTENLPFIIAGDMNTYSGHISYTVFDTAGWKDAFIAASSANCMDAASKQYPGTNVGSDPENYVTSESRRIDFILYDGFDICSYQNIFTQKQNIYPSDHLPIKVRIDFSILF